LPMLKIENSETGRNCLISLKMNEKMGGWLRNRGRDLKMKRRQKIP
jgi:hypothetical protein